MLKNYSKFVLRITFLSIVAFNSMHGMESETTDSNPIINKINTIIQLFEGYKPVDSEKEDSDQKTNSNVKSQLAYASSLNPKYTVGYLVLKKMMEDNIIGKDSKFDDESNKNLINQWIKTHPDEVLLFIDKSEKNKNRNNSDKKNIFFYAVPLIMIGETLYIINQEIKKKHPKAIERKLTQNFESSLKIYENRIPQNFSKELPTNIDNIKKLSNIISDNTNPLQKIIECLKDVFSK